MHIATVAYSVMFVLLFSAILLVSDFESVKITFSTLMGEAYFNAIRESILYALHSVGYGTCIISALLLIFVLQLSLALTLAVTGFIRAVIKRKVSCLIQKGKHTISCRIRELYLQRYIILLYCRMLS